MVGKTNGYISGLLASDTVRSGTWVPDDTGRYELSHYRGGIKITFLYHVSTATHLSQRRTAITVYWAASSWRYYSLLGCFKLKIFDRTWSSRKRVAGWCVFRQF